MGLISSLLDNVICSSWSGLIHFIVLFQNFLSPTADSKDLDCVKRLWSEEGSSFSYKKIYYLITNR